MKKTDNKRGVVSRLANLNVLLKEAATRSTTEVGLLTATTAEEQDKLKHELAYFRLRLAGTTEPPDDKHPLGQLLVECFALMLELDSMWSFDKPVGIRFLHEAMTMKVTPDSVELMMTACDARALLFALRMTLAVDHEGTTTAAMLAATLGTTVRGHATYCAEMLKQLENLPF